MIRVARVGNVEDQCESLNKRVETLESRESVTSDLVKSLVHEEVAELNIGNRKLNLICLNLPESQRTDTRVRQNEDRDF